MEATAALAATVGGVEGGSAKKAKKEKHRCGTKRCVAVVSA
jgi:hypothetical protein